MQRKLVVAFTLALLFICFLTWHFAAITTRSLSKLRILQVETLRETNLAKPNEEQHGVKTVRPATSAKPTKPAPLPELTLAAQDSFYGAGCKENRFRKRFQKLFQEWGRLAKRRNITRFFICFGTFLGSVRNGDHIPYDSDMDVCMFRNDYHKLEAEESKRPLNLNDRPFHLLLQRHSPHPKSDTPRLNCKGNIVRHVADRCSILDPHARFYIHARIWLDIFMIEDHGPKLWDEYRDKIHDRDAILPVKPCKFLGLDTQCPNNTEKYLNVYYGKDYMKPHHVCKGGKWVENMPGARKPFV